MYKWKLCQKGLLLITAPFFITVPYINNSDVANILDLQLVTCSNWYFLKMLHYLNTYVNLLLRAQIFPHIKIQSECERQKWWIILHILLTYPTEGCSWRSEAGEKGVSGFILWLPPCGVSSVGPPRKWSPFSYGYCPGDSSGRGEVKSPSLLLGLGHSTILCWFS